MARPIPYACVRPIIPPQIQKSKTLTAVVGNTNAIF
jgi:hypothetical protein